MDQSSIRETWRSSTSLIFWGVLALTVFGCTASVFEFFFGFIDTAKEYVKNVLDTASPFVSDSKAEGLYKFYAVHSRLAVWTRVFEALTIGGWIAYVAGLSKFRTAQVSEKGVWLAGSLYTACWLGLVGMACAFIGSFLGMFGMLFRFAGWILNLISLFKFHSSFNRLSVEESWNELARRGAGNLRRSYTFGIILTFFPIITFLCVFFIALGSISSIPGIMRDFSGNGAGMTASLIGGYLALFIILAFAGVVLWVLQICYLIAGWGKVKNGSLADEYADEFVSDNTTVVTLCAILGAIVLTVLAGWLCLTPLAQKNATYRFDREDDEKETAIMESILSDDNDGESQSSVKDEEGFRSEAATAEEPVGDEYTYTYKGTINNAYGIEMTLTTDGGAYYTGEYFYTKHKSPIQLSGSLTDDDEHLVLEEYVGEKMTGRFEGTLTRTGYSGTWTSADGKTSYPFSVTRR